MRSCQPVRPVARRSGGARHHRHTRGATSYTKIVPGQLRHQRLPRPRRAVRQSDRSRMPRADAERQAHGQWHVPRARSVPTTGTAQGPWRCGTGQPGATRFTAARVAGSTASACSAARRRRQSSNSPPILANPGSQSTIAGSAVDLAISASDADGNTLTFSAIGLPAGLSLDTGTGRITGAPDHGRRATPVGISVSDGTVSVERELLLDRHDPAAVHARSADAGHAENRRRAGDVYGDDAQRLERPL